LYNFIFLFLPVVQQDGLCSGNSHGISSLLHALLACPISFYVRYPHNIAIMVRYVEIHLFHLDQEPWLARQSQFFIMLFDRAVRIGDSIETHFIAATPRKKEKKKKRISRIPLYHLSEATRNRHTHPCTSHNCSKRYQAIHFQRGPALEATYLTS
jgi:hypothetical protein